MKRRSLSLLAGTLLLAGLGIMLFPGCEDTPDMGNVDQMLDGNPVPDDTRKDGITPLTVEPKQGTIGHEGQSLSFTATGSPDKRYHWEVSIPAHGEFRVTDRSQTAIYTDIDDTGKPVTNKNDNTLIVFDERGYAITIRIN